MMKATWQRDALEGQQTKIVVSLLVKNGGRGGLCVVCALTTAERSGSDGGMGSRGSGDEGWQWGMSLTSRKILIDDDQRPTGRRRRTVWHGTATTQIL